MTRERGSGITPPRVVELLKKEVSEKSILAVSNATGLGLAAIGRYLKGVGEPTTASLQKLADYFKVSVPWLRGEIDIQDIARVPGGYIIKTSKGEIEIDNDLIVNAGIDFIVSIWGNEDEDLMMDRFRSIARSLKKKFNIGE
ncbi:MAG: helix-turn-helix domain-containing protein [Desulfurivibrionaceae bacterium]|jgi:transcriptional regulator with XRE-family HTH domain